MELCCRETKIDFTQMQVKVGRVEQKSVCCVLSVSGGFERRQHLNTMRIQNKLARNESLGNSCRWSLTQIFQQTKYGAILERSKLHKQ
jgi:hypothetical protein